MTQVGVRELKSKLSEYLSRVKQGESVVVTERGTPIAIIMPSASESAEQAMRRLVAMGILTRYGGKPKRLPNPIPWPGKPLSEYVIEGRG